MANASFGVNILPKNNTVTIGNSDSPWTIVSPSLTGTPTAPTAAAGTNTTQIATTAFVQSKLDKPVQAGTQDQILRSDGNGGTVWTNAATQTEIGTAVTNWLDTNVPTGTTVAIDNSLSVQNAAADSKTTGDAIALETANRTAADNDLKSAVNDSFEYITGITPITTENASITKGKYLRTGNASVTLDSASSWATSSDWINYLIPCVEGDTFVVNAQGGGQPRAWAFLKLNSGTTYDVLEPKADQSITVSKLHLTAPEGAVYLAINDKGGYTSYKGINSIENMKVVDDSLMGGNCVNWLSGRKFHRGKSYTTNGITFAWDDGYKKCKISGEASSTALYNIYYSSSVLPDIMKPGSDIYIQLNDFPEWLTLLLHFNGANKDIVINKSSEITVPGNATSGYIQLRVKSGTDIDDDGYYIDVPVISKFPSNAYLKQISENRNINNEIKLLIGGLNDGVPGSNPRRLYTRDLMTVDTPLLVEVEDGWTIIPVYYDSDGTWVTNGGDRDGPYEYVYKPTQYMRFMVMALEEGSHPVLTPEQINDAINHVHFYMGEALVKRYQERIGFEWSSCSIFENFGVIGDSWASGSLHHPDGTGWTGNYQLSWPQILARQIGATAINFTAGGNDCKMWLNNQTYGLPKLLASPKQQLYLINMGINDYNHIVSQSTTHPLELGTIDDVTDDYTQNPDTFYGCYGKIIGNILDHAPLAKIVLISVARKVERAMDVHIKAIADKLELPYINLQDDMFFNSQFFFDGIYDGHPLSYIYGGMASSIQRLLVKCIMENAAYFGTYYGVTEPTNGTPDE